jgi:hypothetical protein
LSKFERLLVVNIATKSEFFGCVKPMIFFVIIDVVELVIVGLRKVVLRGISKSCVLFTWLYVFWVPGIW